MGISGISSSNNSMSVMQMTSANLKDHKSKNIQKEITDVKQQIQKLSSEEELSVNEKADEKKKLQKEKASLDTELKQHQDELLRSQKREIRLAELQEAQNPIKEEETEDEAETALLGTAASTDTAGKESTSTGEQQAQPLEPGTVIAQNSDGTVILKEVLQQAKAVGAAAEGPDENRQTGEAKETAAAVAESEETEEEETDPAAEFRPTAQEMQAMVSADTSMGQADRMGRLVTKTEDGIAVLKGEIKQDSYRGVDTERKEAELSDMQKQREREMGVQFALLGEAGHTMKAADDTESLKDRTQGNAGMNFQVSGLQESPDEQAAQQGFQVSIA